MKMLKNNKVVDIDLEYEEGVIDINIDGVTVAWIDSDWTTIGLMYLDDDEEKAIRNAGFSVDDHYIAMEK